MRSKEGLLRGQARGSNPACSFPVIYPFLAATAAAHQTKSFSLDQIVVRTVTFHTSSSQLSRNFSHHLLCEKCAWK
ncbi:hypothetical protein QC762_0051200 [Podospora pseudocomata]|uniref:Uncharacterized protein n=1 Tax=Podospora pseudocomata TaxID=2093779 RepID=A0ABR0GIV1_9PEZI|nr:hypothetical protein QC762_0051200 [Podospora pseudocomata]